MKKQHINIILIIALLSFNSTAFASASGTKQKPPAKASNQDVQPTPVAGTSFWDWLSSYFYF